MNCLKCGETKEAIKKHKMICGCVDSQTGELLHEYGKHRFKPYSVREVLEQGRVTIINATR